MIKLKDSEFDKVQKLMEQFNKEHTEKERTLAQFKAWLAVNMMLQIWKERLK